MSRFLTLFQPPDSFFRVPPITGDFTDGGTYNDRGCDRPNDCQRDDGPQRQVLTRPIGCIHARNHEHRDQAANCVTFEPCHFEIPFQFCALVALPSGLVQPFGWDRGLEADPSADASRCLDAQLMLHGVSRALSKISSTMGSTAAARNTSAFSTEGRG